MDENINIELYNLVVRFLKLIDNDDAEKLYLDNKELFNDAIDVIQRINAPTNN